VQYTIIILPRAIRDLDDLPRATAERISLRIFAMREDLAGNVKKLTGMHPNYRLRVGDYRVLFEIDGPTIRVHTVRHRREAYDR